MSEIKRRTITFDWYDGPLLEARRVEFPDCPPMVEVETFIVADTDRLERDCPWGAMRFDEDDLLKMLAIVRGQPVEDYHGRDVDPTT